MDMEKLMRWRELTQKYQGKDFWSEIFGNPHTQQMLSSFTEMFGNHARPGTFPPVDIYMNEKEILVVVSLPGQAKEEIQLSLAGDRLSITGNIQPIYKNYTQVITERFYGPFQRTVQLPEVVDKNGIEARFDKGLLEIKFPRICREQGEFIHIK